MNGWRQVLLENKSLLGIAIAALGGAAVGIDRQHASVDSEPGAIGGLRTFTLLGTIAGVCGFLITESYVAPAIVILASTALMVMIVRLGAGRISRDATTEIAAIAVLVSGVAAGLGHLSVASALYAWTVLLLVEKSWLHAFAKRIGVIEFEAAAQFAAMALIVLPLIPSRQFGPGGVLNLRSIWILVLIFSGLSFAGYLARKALGNEPGWVATGLLGGIVSSTQVALAFSRESRSNHESQFPLFGGVLGATSISMLRVCVLCLLIAPSLAMTTLAYVALPVLIGGAAALYGMRRHTKASGSFEEKNPLRLGAALYLSVIFIGSQYLVSFTSLRFGTAGALSSAGLLGSVDIDALVASLVPMVRQGMQSHEAAQLLLLGIIGNTTVKLLITLIWGSGVFRRYTALGFVVILMALIGGFAVIG
jgi:uncharacterized membrane protein (DUF4010 family)